VPEVGFGSESELLLGAIGSARKYELYRELTSDRWGEGVPDLAQAVATKIEERRPPPNCQDVLPVFQGAPTCPERFRQAARLLEQGYGRSPVLMGAPFSVQRLEAARLVRSCHGAGPTGTFCQVETDRLRAALADALVVTLDRAGLRRDPLMARVQRARLSMADDRSLRVSSRGAPVTGSLLGAFGAFLDRKFREYDYYVGVFDALVLGSDSVCRLQFSLDRRSPGYPDCVNRMAQQLYAAFGVPDDARARYVLALLARAEVGAAGQLRFAYEPMPAEDRDMRIIHEGLAKTLAAGARSDDSQGLFFVEKTFFRHLRAEDFQATPVPDGSKPLLAQIMANPDYWSSEAVQRFTARLVKLEENARDVYAAREPDPSERDEAMVGLLGATSHVLRSATYTYPSFTFSPSTAPDHWFARNLIPYELAFDLVDGDVAFTWQPTWSLSPTSTLSIRGTLGIAGGLVDSGTTAQRENYMILGLDWTRSTDHELWSSWGVMAGWYHAFAKPVLTRQDAPSYDVHIGLFKDRIRFGLGTRDATDFANNWFLLFGIADVPGLVYWLTR